MKKLLFHFAWRFFDSRLDFRVRLFNVLAVAGMTVSAVVGVINYAAGHGVAILLVDLAGALLSYALLRFASQSGRYQLCYIITIAVVFLGLFPYLFFRMGGYHGGIPAFFIFAVVFTVFMLEGKGAVIVAVLELAVYAGLFLLAYRRPESVRAFDTEAGYLISTLMDLLVSGVALGAAMFLQIRMYRKQQQKLDEQNAMLAQINRSKTELLGNISHEMKTPLTVISTEIQTAGEMLRDMEAGEGNAARRRLQNAQREIMRLSRMVNGSLSLASLSENTSQTMLHFAALLENTADTWRELLAKQGNTLTTDIAHDLPAVFGNADLLIQVLSNLLHNAGGHTRDGQIGIRARRDGSAVKVTVWDTGAGIAPALLPHVLERGVSGQGRSGYGLYLCKTVIEAHGGELSVESAFPVAAMAGATIVAGDTEVAGGTAVSFTLPAYAGQFGGERP